MTGVDAFERQASQPAESGKDGSLSGLLLLVLRETSLMGILLIVHLGFVLAFFVTMPISKFVHGIYRYIALVRHSQEQSAARDEH